MKRLIALLMVLCLVMGLGACKDPVQTPEGTGETENIPASDTSTTPSTEATGTTGVFFPDNSDLIDPVKFGGKTIEIYGYSGSYYKDLNNYDGQYYFMVRAAVDEWATLNNVTIKYQGGYDQNVILGDFGAGGHPDLLLYCDKFPLPVVTGIIRPFTQEEYNALADTCGTYYLDMLQYKGQSYGVLSPWSGGQLFYYNKTQFEKYGVKSPEQYFLEGNWNWDTYETCVKEISRDEDGDGVYELYGSGCTSLLLPEFYAQQMNEDGTLTSLIRNSEAYKRYLEIYNGLRKTKYEGPYKPAYLLSADKRLAATSIGEAYWYDFAHMHRVLDNGDVVKAIPVPKYTNESESFYQYTTVYSSILYTCDEPEATVALMNYILRVGMRYMSDYSLGLYKCNYQGIRGASEYSADWKARFDKIIAERMTQFDKLTDWDQEFYNEIVSYLQNADVHYTDHSYPGEGSDTTIEHTITYPTVDQVADREEKWIKVFNELYAQ